MNFNKNVIVILVAVLAAGSLLVIRKPELKDYLSEGLTLGSKGKVVVVDVRRIIAARAAQMVSGADIDKNIDFVNALRLATDKLSESGLIVLNERAVVSVPDSLDFTKSVAEQLGVAEFLDDNVIANENKK